jgi:hypothetical protein
VFGTVEIHFLKNKNEFLAKIDTTIQTYTSECTSSDQFVCSYCDKEWLKTDVIQVYVQELA